MPISETWTPVLPSVRIGILPAFGSWMSFSPGAPGMGPWGGWSDSLGGVTRVSYVLLLIECNGVLGTNPAVPRSPGQHRAPRGNCNSPGRTSDRPDWLLKHEGERGRLLSGAGPANRASTMRSGGATFRARHKF